MNRLAKDPDGPEPISMAERIQRQQDDEEVVPLLDSGGQPYPEPTESQREASHRPVEAKAPYGKSISLVVPKWQNIIWREWATCVDEEYAQHLFNLVSNTALGWGSVITLALSGALYGLPVGYLLGLIALNWNVHSGAWLLTGTLPLLLALLIGMIGVVAGDWISQRLSWRVWLGLLTPNVFANKLGGLGSSSISLFIGFITGLLGLGLFAGAILGGLSGLVSGERRRVTTSAWIGAVGAMIGGLVGQGGWLGLGLSLLTGVWLGITWGGGPLGLLVSWLGMLLGLAILV